MSFGFGVGDIASAVLLARTVYKKCRDSPGQYQQLTSDVLQLANVLEDLEDLAKQRHLEPSRKKRLLEHMDAVNKVLIDANKLLDDYGKMSSKSRGVFDRLGWDQEGARDIRTRLTATVTMINTFYQRLNTSEFIQLQKKLDLWMAEMNAGHRDTDSVSLVVSGNKTMENSAWPQIIKDLAAFGVGEEVVNANRSFIVTTIIDAFNAGQLLGVETIKGDVEITLHRTSQDDLEDAFLQNPTGTQANFGHAQPAVDEAEIASVISQSSSADKVKQRVPVTADNIRPNPGVAPPLVDAYTEGIWRRAAAPKRTVNNISGLMHTMALSKDGKLIAGISHGAFATTQVQIFNADTGKLLRKSTVNTYFGSEMSFSPRDSRLLAFIDEQSFVRLWDTSEDKVERRMFGDVGLIVSVSFSADGSLLGTGAKNGSVKVWNVDTKGLVHHWEYLTHLGTALAFSPDGLFLTFARDYSYMVLEPKSSVTNRALGTYGFDYQQLLTRPREDVKTLAWSPNGLRLACGTNRGTVEVLKVTNGKFEAHQLFSVVDKSRISSLSFSWCGNLIASAIRFGYIKVWDMDKGSPLAEPNGGWPDEDIVIACFSPDDRHLMTGSLSGYIRLWEIREEESGYKIEAAK